MCLGLRSTRPFGRELGIAERHIKLESPYQGKRESEQTPATAVEDNHFCEACTQGADTKGPLQPGLRRP